MNRTYTSQIIQFVGTVGTRRPAEQQINLMQMHGFRFNTSEKNGDHWTMEYTRIVTRFETVSKKMVEKLGANFKTINNKDSVVFNADASTSTSASA